MTSDAHNAATPTPLTKGGPARRTWLRGVVIVAAVGASLLVGLLCAEVLVRIARPQDLTGVWLDTAPQGFRWNRAGASVRHEFRGTSVRYRLNSLRTRGPEPSGAAHTVLVLGDSYTFGFLLDEADGWVARLAARCDEHFGVGQWQWLNAGIAGAGLGEHVAMFEATAPKARPDVVVLFVNGDDARRADALGLFRLAPDGTLIESPVAIHGGARSLLVTTGVAPWLLEHSHLLQLARRTLQRNTPPTIHTDIAAEQARILAAEQRFAALAGEDAPSRVPPDAERAARLCAALLGRLKAGTDAIGARLVIVRTGIGTAFDACIGPNRVDRIQRGDRLWEDPRNRYTLARLARTCSDLSIRFIDLDPAFTGVTAAQLRDLLIPLDGHPSARGTQAVTDALWPSLAPVLSDVAATPRR